MRVIKRNSEYEDVSFDKVLNRIKLLSNDLDVDIYDIGQKVCSRIYDLVKTSELDELAAQICSSMVIDNPDYGTLASRLIISNHQKNTSPSFSETMIALYNNTVNWEHCPLISETLYEITLKNKEKLNSYINYEKDYNFDYFGFKTLERSYLIRVGSKVVERPQHMFMRVALGIHSDDIKEALQTYDLMSRKMFTHATPTLFNSGTNAAQMSSCYLQCMKGDSIDSIFDTVKETARISKHAGGIGIHIHNIRAKGSRIRSTNGTSDGLVPLLKVFNHVGRYINQCFTPDTLVFMEKGVKKMKDVKEGDKLMTFDFENDCSIFKPVLGVSISQIEKEILEIQTSIGTDTVKVTKEHELYVKIDSDTPPKFIPANELEVGNYMAYPEKKGMLWFRITNINTIDYKGDVYDFNMEDNHNYTVVNLGLVHNSGKRNGSIAVYLEPWHADVESFLDLKKNHGNEEDRARDLFYALWIPDLFMERIRKNGTWSLMCPDRCKGLSDVYGEEFVKLYEQYEENKMYRKQVPAQELWFKILEAQIETGVPYILYKDAANSKSNQKNLGTIKSSNLCTEIIEYSSPDETSVCNLASICLPSYIVTGPDDKYFDFERLHEIAMIATKNLNKIIDINFYPTETSRRSNLRHRPIGIGIQGLADTYIIMGYPFDSEEAADLNRKIFETIYHGAVEASMMISKKRQELIEEFNMDGLSEIRKQEIKKYLNWNEYEIETERYPGAYSSFEGSPASQGLLQFDLWEFSPGNGRYDWDQMKKDIMKYGMRNSLLLAPMPTASTSQIMGFTESFECITSNVYKRKTLAGEFVLVNKYLINDLIKENLWNKDMKNKILLGEGSIQNIQEIPLRLRKLYKTVWEISQKVIIDQAADRAVYICQSQSMNLFMEDPDFKKLTSMHFYAFDKKLKTGSYYIRSKARAKVQQFTIDPNFEKKEKKVVCTDEVCTLCSS